MVSSRKMVQISKQPRAKMLQKKVALLRAGGLARCQCSLVVRLSHPSRRVVRLSLYHHVVGLLLHGGRLPPRFRRVLLDHGTGGRRAQRVWPPHRNGGGEDIVSSRCFDLIFCNDLSCDCCSSTFLLQAHEQKHASLMQSWCKHTQR